MPSASTAGGPLAGVRVLGLEQSVAGPLCTRILSDMGAEVVKWERSGVGDFARHWDTNARGESAQFWWLNRGKRSVAVDLRDPRDRELLDEHLAQVDVLVHNMSPAAASRLGLAAADVSERFPHLINCQISGYGAASTYSDRKAYDMLIQAEAGIMAVTGTPDTPTRVGVSLCDVATGIYAATLVLGALQERHQTGVGRSLDVAMLDVGLEFVAPILTSWLNAGVTYPRIPQHHHAISPYGIFACADGQIAIAIEQDAEWQRFCRVVLGRPELGDRADLEHNSGRQARSGEVNAIVNTALSALTRREVAALLEEGEFAFAELRSISEVASHPVLSDREVLTTSASTTGESVTTLRGLASRLFEVETGRPRPPLLGEDQYLLEGGLDGMSIRSEASS